MASQAYLAAKAPPPSPLKRFFDQRVLPVAIDGAAGIEAALESVAQRTRRQPMTMFGLAFAASLLAAVLIGRGAQTRTRLRSIS